MKESSKRIWTAVVFLLSPLLAFYLMQFVLGGWPWEYGFKTVLANYLCIAFAYYFLCAVTNHIVFSAIFINAVFLIWGAANYFVASFRGNPVLPWDFTALRTAMAVAGNYKFIPTWQMIAGILFVAGFGILIRKLCIKGQFKLTKQNALLRTACLLLGGICLFGTCNREVLEELGIETDVWDQAKAYKENGAAASFVMNMKFMEVEAPAHYSAENVDEIMASVSIKDNDPVMSEISEKPNIIAIMNESWADFESFGNLELTESVFKYIHSLDGIQGDAYASVFGAGTSASEFEFLTGNSMAFLPSGSIPYQQYILTPMSSMASLLKSNGYKTLAIHPGERTSWQRNTAYPLLGFDAFKSMDDMDVVLTEEHGYVSDASSFNQIIYEFEHKQPEEKLFVFNVTIQNHGSYTDKAYETTVQLKDEPGRYPMAEQYLTLAHKTDEAFMLLVDYFETQDEPTIIVMFGDHQPSLEQGFLDKAYGVTQDEMTMEQYMGKFKVPFIIWANYSLPGDNIQYTSLNFLAQYVLKYAGIEATQYGAFLQQVKAEIPALTFAGYFDTEGHAYSHLETTDFSSLIEQYSVIQYENIFGKSAENQKYFSTEQFDN